MANRVRRLAWEDVALCVVPTLYLLLSMTEVVDYLRTEGEGYPIGWGGGGWSYREFHNYWVSFGLSALLPAFGIALFFFEGRLPRLGARLTAGAVTLLVLAAILSGFAAQQFETLRPALQAINFVATRILCLGLCGATQ